MVPAMTTAARMTRCPRPFDRERGAEARAHVPGLTGELAALVEGAGGCSPYLCDLLAKEAAWIAPALDDPEAAFDSLLAGLGQGRDHGEDPAVALRVAKRRVALLTGLCDLGGIWDLPGVTGRLSDFAGRATDVAIRAALAHEMRRGKLPGFGEDRRGEDAGMVAMAMGKMGAGELNYSSDIDLIVLFDEDRFERDDFADARAALIRATRRMTAMLSDMTGEGYVFRTDLRLRPDPSVTPVCLGMEAAERYYESLGRTWERAAWIKARPCAGDLEGGARFVETMRPFVWRRHLDFASIEDAHDMRLKIRDAKGLHGGREGGIPLAGHDMKQGAGGIRAIEFFTQFHQLVAGGRDPSLRQRATVEALAALAGKGWIPEATAEALSRHYAAHREVEHRVQMIRDAQTHALPKEAEGFDRLAAMMDTDAGSLRRDIAARLEEVCALTDGFFDPEARGEGGTAAAPAAEEESAAAAPAADPALIARWEGYPALRTARARRIFDRLKPTILARLAEASKPDEALQAFDGFLAGLPAGVQIFSLFDANPQLVDLIVDIAATSPDLARHLARNASVFDAVIGGGFFADWPETAALVADLEARLAREADYEARLDAARRWQREWHFRIGVHHLRGLIDADTAGREYADLAETVLRVLFPVVTDEFARRHGPPPGRGAVALGMGSLGAGRLNARSDLDLIVVYDADGVESSEGRKPLPARTWYARLTQALVTALSAPMSEGRLYEVDMRLRPSGNQGPVATSIQAWRDYQAEKAWAWEHLALTRARVVAGTGGASEDLAGDVADFRAELLGRGRDAGPVLAEVAAMRARIAGAKAPAGPWEVKIGPGRNQEIELLAQAGAVIAGRASGWIGAGLSAAVEEGWLDPEGRETLLEAWTLGWRIGQVAKLLSDRPLDPDEIGAGGRAMLLRETGAPDIATLASRLEATRAAAADVIDRVLAPHEKDGTGDG